MGTLAGVDLPAGVVVALSRRIEGVYLRWKRRREANRVYISSDIEASKAAAAVRIDGRGRARPAVSRVRPESVALTETRFSTEETAESGISLSHAPQS